MVRKVIWSDTASEDFVILVEFLEFAWNDKVIRSFIDALGASIEQIRQSPEIGKKVKRKKNVRFVIVLPYMKIYYRISPNHITLLALFDTRQDPNKLKSMGLAEPVVHYLPVETVSIT